MQRPVHLLHPGRHERGDQTADLGFDHCLQVVTIDRTRPWHAIVPVQKDFRWNLAYRGGDGRDRDFTKVGQHRRAGQDEHRALFIGW